MFENIIATAENNVGQLTLNRPHKLNALSSQTLREIIHAARWFDEQEQVKVVLVQGAGRAFSAGADLQNFAGQQGSARRHSADLGRQMAEALEGMRAVTIAAIHGWCVGGALVLASACDIRIAAEDAIFSIPEVDLGIPLAWGGIPRLVREIGPAMTKELVMSCRPFDAAEAKAAGFLNRVVAAERLAAEAQKLVAQLARKAAYPLYATKRHVNAVTAQMVGSERSWSDADSLMTAFLDPECGERAKPTLKGRRPMVDGRQRI